MYYFNNVSIINAWFCVYPDTQLIKILINDEFRRRPKHVTIMLVFNVREGFEITSKEASQMRRYRVSNQRCILVSPRRRHNVSRRRR